MPPPALLVALLALAAPVEPADEQAGVQALVAETARGLTDAQLGRFAVFLREVTSGGGEAAARAAAVKASLTMRQVGGLSLLFSQFRAAQPPRRDFERRYGAAATRLLTKHEPALLETQRGAIERAMAGLGPSGAGGGRSSSPVPTTSGARPKGPAGASRGGATNAWADCPSKYRFSASVDGGAIVYYCERPCLIKVRAGGNQGELECSKSVSTRGDHVRISVASIGKQGLLLGATFTVDARMDGASPAGQGFSANAPSLTQPGAGQVFAAGDIREPDRSRSFGLSCGGKQPPRAEVVIDWAAPSGRVHYSDPPTTGLNWASHGTAAATLYECGYDGQVVGTMEVEARF